VGETRSIERRYFINSIAADAKRFVHAVRGHWSVENRLHWRLDGVFRENESRIRKGNARAYLLVGGGHPIWEEAIESLVNPRQSEMKQMIEPRFTPAHTYPFERC
jgi:hypothetical protein